MKKRFKLGTLMWIVALVATFFGGMQFGERREIARKNLTLMRTFAANANGVKGWMIEYFPINLSTDPTGTKSWTFVPANPPSMTTSKPLINETEKSEPDSKNKTQ